MKIFEVEFEKPEIDILNKYRVYIRGNERFYLFTEFDTVPIYGVPRRYSVKDFVFEGTSWKSLILSFGEWFIKQVPSFTTQDFLELNKGSIKNIFLKIPESNFIGPLSNGLYINNNLGVF